MKSGQNGCKTSLCTTNCLPIFASNAPSYPLLSTLYFVIVPTLVVECWLMLSTRLLIVHATLLSSARQGQHNHPGYARR